MPAVLTYILPLAFILLSLPSFAAINASQTLIFQTGGTERARMTNDGISTTTLRVDGYVYATGLRPSSANSFANNPAINFGGDGIFRPESGSLAFGTGSTERARINSTGLTVNGMISSSVATALGASAGDAVILAAVHGSENSLVTSLRRKDDLPHIRLQSRDAFSGNPGSYMDFISPFLANGVSYFEWGYGTGGPIMGLSSHIGLWVANNIQATGNITTSADMRAQRAGIGINPAVPLHVSGTARIQNGSVVTCNIGTGTGTTACTSDVRLKKDITPIPNALAKLATLTGVTFRWKAKDAPQGEHLGVIAQEVEKVFPQAVHTQEDGIKTVDYAVLVAPLIQAVKELHAENATIRAESQSLSRRLEGLAAMHMGVARK